MNNNNNNNDNNNSWDESSRLEETCCHSNSSEKPSANTYVKNSKGVNIYIYIHICISSHSDVIIQMIK